MFFSYSSWREKKRRRRVKVEHPEIFIFFPTGDLGPNFFSREQNKKKKIKWAGDTGSRLPLYICKMEVDVD